MPSIPTIQIEGLNQPMVTASIGDFLPDFLRGIPWVEEVTVQVRSGRSLPYRNTIRVVPRTTGRVSPSNIAYLKMFMDHGAWNIYAITKDSNKNRYVDSYPIDEFLTTLTSKDSSGEEHVFWLPSDAKFSHRSGGHLPDKWHQWIDEEKLGDASVAELQKFAKFVTWVTNLVLAP